MSNSLIQAELDLAEEHLLCCLFKSAENPQIGGIAASFLALQGKSLPNLLNNLITEFEVFVTPWLTETGYLDGEKISLSLKNRFNKEIAIPNCRLIEITRALEPCLKWLSNLIQ